jgi:hypothetical protein
MIPGFINIFNSWSTSHYNFLICFLILPISISWLRSSLATFAKCGIGPSIAATKLDCAERSAGGTRIPNQRIGSAGLAGFLLSFSSNADVVFGSFSDSSSFDSSPFESLTCASSFFSAAIERLNTASASPSWTVLVHFSFHPLFKNGLEDLTRSESLACARHSCLVHSG